MSRANVVRWLLNKLKAIPATVDSQLREAQHLARPHKTQSLLGSEVAAAFEWLANNLIDIGQFLCVSVVVH